MNNLLQFFRSTKKGISFILFFSALFSFQLVTGQSSIASLELGTTNLSSNTTGSATFTTKNANITTLPSLTLTAAQQSQAGGTGYVSSRAWNSGTQNTARYWTFTLTAAAGYSISVSQITLRGQSSGQGPDDIALRSDDDSYASNIATQTSFQGTSTSIVFSGLTLSNKTAITFRIYGWSGGNANGTWRIGDGSNSSLDIDVIGTVAGNYYSRSTGDLNLTSSWTTSTNGIGGTSPTNFTTAGQVFNIRNNATPTIGAAWTVSGTDSKIVLGDGTNACNFTIPSGFAVTGTLDVNAQGTLTAQNTTLPTLGALATNSTVNFASTGSQTIPVKTFFNLTSSSTGARTLASGIVEVDGTFTSGTNSYTTTGNTVDFGSASAQTIPALNYNNITNSGNGNRTLANSGTVGIAGSFTPGSGTYTVTGSTIDYNGTSGITLGTFTYNNLTISGNKGGGTVSFGTGTVTIGGSLNYTATNATQAAGTGIVSFNSASSQTIPALNYYNLTASGGARVLASSGAVGIANTFTPGVGAFTVAGSTVNFNGTGNQTIPVIAYNNLTVSGARAANDVSFGGGVTIGGNLTISATGTSASGFLYFNNTGTPRTFTIAGDYIQTGYDAEFGSVTGGTTTINLAGSFQKTAGNLTTTVAANGIINLSGSNVNLQSNGGTETKWINFNVLNGSTCTLNGAFSYWGTSGDPGTFTVNSGGTVNCGALNFTTVGGNATFINNGTLGIGSSAGITTAGTASGNIQTTTRTFNVAGFYIYNGTTQNTGSALPTTAITGGVTIANGATVTAANAIIVNTPGVLAVNGTLVPGATQVMSGTGTLNGSGTVQVNQTTGNADFLSQYTQTTKILTSLTVEYTVLTGGQGVSATTYNNLKLNNTSGSNGSGGSITVNGTLTLATGGAFSIGANTLTLNGVVAGTGTLTGSNTSNVIIGGNVGTLRFTTGGANNSLRALTLNNGATATLGNALNITAYDGTSEGVLTVTGTGVLTTGGFLTIKSNINGTARIAQGNTSGGYITGNVIVERYIPQNSAKQWRLLASNTSGQTVNQAWQENQVGFNSNTAPGFGTMIAANGANVGAVQALGFDTLSYGTSLYSYNSATDVLVPVTNTLTKSIASEQGYFLFIRGDRGPNQFNTGVGTTPTPPTSSTVLRSNGTLFLGDQAAVSTGASNYGLVRNPYPSRIDMRQIVRGGLLNDAYQVWDSKLSGAYGVGGFQTFSKITSGINAGSYAVSPGGGSYGVNGSVNNFIESGAAFFIQSTGGTGSAQVTEACKAASSSINSYRPLDGQSVDKRMTYTLFALNPGSADVVDGGLVYFNDEYSNDVNIDDVRKSGNFNENFGIVRNNTDIVVERRKDLVANDSIFFKMSQLRQISYRIDISGLNFDPLVTNAILQDKFTGTNTPLDLSNVTSYTFAVSNIAASSAADRFRIVLASSNIFSGTGNWTDNVRWSRGTPPSVNENVVIAADANATLNTDFIVAGNLSMAATSSLIVNPTKTLTVSGTADFAGQSVTFKSDESGYGSLGQVTGTLIGATNVTVERYIPNNGFRSWRLLAVPTFGNGQTIRQAWQEGNANPLPLQNNLTNRGTLISGAFSTQAAAAAAGFDSTTSQPGMQKWNGTGWSAVTTTNAPIAAEKAYFLFVRGDRSKGITGAVNNTSATTLRTNGTVYTGTQQYNVPTAGFALIANTYPSAINFTGLTRSNVSNLFYVWDSKKQNGNSLGMYQTFSATNGYNCIISGGSYTFGQPNVIIESGQAFLVRGGNTAGGGTIALLESAKVSGSGNLGFRPAALPAKIDSRLVDVDNTVLDANVVVFDKAYSKSVDADDAEKLGNPGVNFAVEINSKILAIEGTQPVTENDVVQFRMWNLKQQDYKLEFETSNLNLQNLYAVLEDNYTGVSKEIDVRNSVTTISFTVDNNPASSAANRFRVVFSKNKPAGNVLIKPSYTIAPNPVEGSTVNLLFNKQPAGKYSVRIISKDGKMITTKVLNHAGGNGNQLIILPTGIVTGNYQVEIIAPDNSKSVKQLFVKSIL